MVTRQNGLRPEDVRALDHGVVTLDDGVIVKVRITTRLAKMVKKYEPIADEVKVTAYPTTDRKASVSLAYRLSKDITSDTFPVTLELPRDIYRHYALVARLNGETLQDRLLTVLTPKP